jgi:hypothetical protein
MKKPKEKTDLNRLGICAELLIFEKGNKKDGTLHPALNSPDTNLSNQSHLNNITKCFKIKQLMSKLKTLTNHTRKKMKDYL